MKIAAIHLGFFYAGGGERLVLEEVRGLRELGHDVELFAPIVDRDACYPDLIDEVRVHSLVPRPPAWVPGRVALAVLLSCLLAPVLVLRLRRFDAVLAANQPSLWIAWVARLVVGKPYVAYLAQPNRVLYPRAIDVSLKSPNLDYRIFSLLAHALRPLVAWTDRVSVAGAAELLANGTHMANVLGRIYGRKADPCPAGSHAVPQSQIRADRRSGELRVGDLVIPKPYVLVTNRHFPVKRFEYAIRAMGSVPSARLVITGAFTLYTEKLRHLANELGVADRIIFTGLVADPILRRLYDEAAVYVYPAPEEDYGMGIVEAMGHATPVVAWNAAGPTSTVQPGVTGVLVEPFDEAAFAAAIDELVRDPVRAERLGRAGWLKVDDGLGYDSHCAHLATSLGRSARLRRKSHALRGLLQTAIGLLLLAIWARSVPLQQVAQQAHVAHWLPIAGMVALAVCSALLRAWRWTLLLNPVKRIGVVAAYWMEAAGGLLNYVIPLRTGDAARAYWLHRNHGIAPGAGLATILVDKVFDLGAVVVALTVGAALAHTATGGGTGLAATALVAAALLVAAVGTAVVGPRLARTRFLARILPERVAAAIAGQAFAFRAGTSGIANPARAAGMAFLSVAAIGIDMFAFSLLFRALDLPIPTASAMGAYPALLLTYAAPSGPGYVGSLEIAGSIILGAGLGLSAAAAAGAILVYHVITAVNALALGLLGLRMIRPAKVALMPSRVAVFHCGFTYSGGGERLVLEEVLGLRSRGYEVECYAPTVDARSCYPELMAQVGVRTFLPALPRWVPLHDAFNMVAASALVPLYAWRFRSVDVIFGCNQPGVWIAWWAAKILHKPYFIYLNQPNRLIHPRAIDRETGWQNKRDYYLLNAVIQRMKGFYHWADHRSTEDAGEMLVNGRYIGDIIRETYHRGAVDCPAGCHVEPGFPLAAEMRFAGSVEVNGFVIRRPFALLTNRHFPQKRFDLAIRAMALVRREHPDVQLVVPGPFTPYTAELVRLIDELELQDTVILTGQIGETMLLRLYAEAAVYVYPAPEEDFGMGVIESMAKGVPVVAWNQAGPTVTVDHPYTGYLAKPLDVEDYARGIAHFLDDAEANQEAGRRAWERARLFDWEHHVNVVEHTMLEVFGSARVSAPSVAADAAR